MRAMCMQNIHTIYTPLHSIPLKSPCSVRWGRRREQKQICCHWLIAKCSILNGNRVAAYPMLYFLFFCHRIHLECILHQFWIILHYFSGPQPHFCTLYYCLFCWFISHCDSWGVGGVSLIGRTLRTEPFNKSFL